MYPLYPLLTSAALDPNVSGRFEQSWDTLHDAEVGDFVKFDHENRKAALEVVEVPGGDPHTIAVEGSRGGRYEITGDTNPDGTPNLKTDKGQNADDLRPATDEEIRDFKRMSPDYAEIDETPGVEAGKEGSQPRSVGDLRRQGPPEGMDWGDFASPVGMEEGASHTSGDDYVSDVTDDPAMDFKKFQKEADIPDSNGGFVSGLLGSDPTWTFVDELLSIGWDVPKSVNNWKLVDYGIVTDENLDSFRRAVWSNVDTDEAVALTGIWDGDANKWFVHHADDIGDTDPEGEYDDLDLAFQHVEDILYEGAGDDVDMRVVEDPQSGHTEVWDATTNTQIVRALADAKDADPYGIRSYITAADTPQFIQDLDAALVTFAKWLAGLADDAGDAWDDFVEGSGLPTRERVRAWANGLDFTQLGEDVRAALLMAASGLRKRFTGLEVYPVIEHDELGADVEYLYASENIDEDAPKARISIDPARLSGLGDDFVGDYVPDAVVEQVESRFLDDSLLTEALQYEYIVETARWMKLEEYSFKIPDPWSDQVTTRRRTGGGGGGGGKTATSYSDLVSGGGETAPDLVRVKSLDEDNLGALLAEHDEPGADWYLVYLAIANEVRSTVDGKGDWQGRDKHGKKSLVGNPRKKYVNVADQFSPSQFDFAPVIDTLDLYYLDDSVDDFITAVDKEIGDEVNFTSDDFDDTALTMKSREEQREAGQEGAQQAGQQPEAHGPERPPQSDDDGQSGGTPPQQTVEQPGEEPGGADEFTEADRIRVDNLVNDIEEGRKSVSDLSTSDRDLLAQAQEEHDILPEGAAATLRRIREGGEEETVDDMLAHAKESGILDGTSDMDTEEREKHVDEQYSNMTNPGDRDNVDL